MEPSKTEITLREVYDLVLEMKFELNRLPEKVDDHEKRIRSLEYKVWSAAGITGIVSVVLSQLVAMLVK